MKEFFKNKKVLISIASVLILTILIVGSIFLFKDNKESKLLKEQTYTMYAKINPLVKFTFKETYYECTITNDAGEEEKTICGEKEDTVIDYTLINDDAKDIYNTIDFKGKTVLDALIVLCDVARDNEVAFESLEIVSDYNFDSNELMKEIENGSKYESKINVFIDFKELLNENEVIEDLEKGEHLEDNKYITINLKLVGECKSINECKVESFTIENDESNIFKDLDLVGLDYADVYGIQDYSLSNPEDSALNKIFEISKNYNLNYIPDYRYMVNSEKYNNIRKIVLKPFDELEYKGIINLNENVYGEIRIAPYMELDASFFKYDKKSKFYYVPDNVKVTINDAKKQISSEVINKINESKLWKIEGEGEEQGVPYLIASYLILFGNPRLYNSPELNLLDPTINKGYSEIYGEDFAYMKKPGDFHLVYFYTPYYDYEDKITTYKKVILDEKICEDYKISCDRW